MKETQKLVKEFFDLEIIREALEQQKNLKPTDEQSKENIKQLNDLLKDYNLEQNDKDNGNLKDIYDLIDDKRQEVLNSYNNEIQILTDQKEKEQREQDKQLFEKYISTQSQHIQYQYQIDNFNQLNNNKLQQQKNNDQNNNSNNQEQQQQPQTEKELQILKQQLQLKYTQNFGFLKNLALKIIDKVENRYFSDQKQKQDKLENLDETYQKIISKIIGKAIQQNLPPKYCWKLNPSPTIKCKDKNFELIGKDCKQKCDDGYQRTTGGKCRKRCTKQEQEKNICKKSYWPYMYYNQQNKLVSEYQKLKEGEKEYQCPTHFQLKEILFFQKCVPDQPLKCKNIGYQNCNFKTACSLNEEMCKETQLEQFQNLVKGGLKIASLFVPGYGLLAIKVIDYVMKAIEIIQGIDDFLKGLQKAQDHFQAVYLSPVQNQRLIINIFQSIKNDEKLYQMINQAIDIFIIDYQEFSKISQTNKQIKALKQNQEQQKDKLFKNLIEIIMDFQYFTIRTEINFFEELDSQKRQKHIDRFLQLFDFKSIEWGDQEEQRQRSNAISLKSTESKDDIKVSFEDLRYDMIRFFFKHSDYLYDIFSRGPIQQIKKTLLKEDQYFKDKSDKNFNYLSAGDEVVRQVGQQLSKGISQIKELVVQLTQEVGEEFDPVGILSIAKIFMYDSCEVSKNYYSNDQVNLIQQNSQQKSKKTDYLYQKQLAENFEEDKSQPILENIKLNNKEIQILETNYKTVKREQMKYQTKEGNKKQDEFINEQKQEQQDIKEQIKILENEKDKIISYTKDQIKNLQDLENSLKQAKIYNLQSLKDLYKNKQTEEDQKEYQEMVNQNIVGLNTAKKQLEEDTKKYKNEEKQKLEKINDNINELLQKLKLIEIQDISWMEKKMKEFLEKLVELDKQNKKYKEELLDIQKKAQQYKKEFQKLQEKEKYYPKNQNDLIDSIIFK